MERKQAQQAIDEAMSDSFKTLFSALLLSFMSETGHEEALKRFENGLGVRDEAYSKATLAVERIFPE